MSVPPQLLDNQPMPRSDNQHGGLNLRQESPNTGQIEIAILDLGVKLRQHIPEFATVAHD
jgi:hypothetical protein